MSRPAPGARSEPVCEPASAKVHPAPAYTAPHQRATGDHPCSKFPGCTIDPALPDCSFSRCPRRPAGASVHGETSPALRAALEQIAATFDTPRLIVNSVDRGEGVFFWEVKSQYRPAVEAEIARLQQADGVVHSEFYQPWRENRDGVMWWRATGFTRDVPPFRVTHPVRGVPLRAAE